MKFALILEPEVIDDLPKRSRLIETLRHTKGVLSLDVEMAGNGLLLANISKGMDARTLEKFDGIERISGMGVKHALLD